MYRRGPPDPSGTGPTTNRLSQSERRPDQGSYAFGRPGRVERQLDVRALHPVDALHRGLRLFHDLARDRVDAWFRERGVAPKIYGQVAGNEAIVSMVSLGLGVGVVPQIVLDNSTLASRVRVLDVQPALAAYDLGLVTLKRHLNNPLVRAFWSLASTS